MSHIISAGTKGHNRWDLYYTWVQILLQIGPLLRLGSKCYYRLMGPLLRLGPNVIGDGTVITLRSSYYNCLGQVCCKTTAAFLPTSPTALWAPRRPPSVFPQNVDELFDTPRRLRPMNNDLLATGHRAQHCVWVQRIGVVANNFSTYLRVFQLVRTDSRFARLMLSTEDPSRWMDNDASKNTEFVGVHVQRNHPRLFSKPIGKRPAPTRSCTCGSSMISTFTMRCSSTRHFVLGRSMFLPLRRFSSCSSSHRLGSGGRSN